MFKQIQNRLLISYLVVLSIILGGFAIAVRVVFVRSLANQLTSKLTALGQGAASSIEIDNGRLKVESNFSAKELIAQNQALQWFNAQGQEVGRQGKFVMMMRFSTEPTIQVQQGNPSIQGVTLPVVDDDSVGTKIVGYVRASQSLAELEDTSQRLNLGLGGGVVMALILSGLGGIWLTRQAMQPIEQSFQRLQQFTADASHELRSPLMVVKSNAAVALKYHQGMREEDAEKFEAIASATQQMTRLTEDLLLLARSDRLPENHWEMISLSDLLHDLVKCYKPQASTRSLQFTARIAPSLQVMGNKMQISRLLSNLIDNAFYYTPALGKVMIQAAQRGLQIEISIEDTGVGIAPEHLEQVFDRFWRADGSRTHWEGGSGLGLAIAQSIAKLHGGQISVVSETDQGSCFIVRLPVAR
jgi:two-component system, OmpR family, manganese sensing sensor histidine kinase